jgi:hypothetical protein
MSFTTALLTVSGVLAVFVVIVAFLLRMGKTAGCRKSIVRRIYR